MVEVDVAEAAPRVQELVDAALRGEEVVIVRGGDRVSLSPLQPPLDVEAHLAALRKRIAGGDAPIPMSELEIQAEWDELRGRT